MFSLVSITLFSRDLDIDKSRQTKTRSLWNMDLEKVMISWVDNISNEEVLAQVNETRTMLNAIWTRKTFKHRWMGHVLWQNTAVHGEISQVRKCQILLCSTTKKVEGEHWCTACLKCCSLCKAYHWPQSQFCNILFKSPLNSFTIMGSETSLIKNI